MTGKNKIAKNGREEEECLKSPATTPGSVDEERFLVPPYQVKINEKTRWFTWDKVPLAICTISLLEIVFFQVANEPMQKSLRFEPSKIQQAWRFLTYMLVHDDQLHLVLNLVMQILFAYFLEVRHHRIRVVTLYFAGGITGALGAACFNSDIVIGASGGVYALLIAHCADLLMNYENMTYKTYRLLCIVIIVLFDIGYNNIHFFSKEEPSISWGAHVFGGIAGLFLGLALFKKDEFRAKRRKLALFWTGIVLYAILMISLVIVAVQIRRCTPLGQMWRGYVYFC